MSCPAQQRAAALDRLAMIVELERDADHFGAGPGGERGDDRAVDAAGHGDDDPRGRRAVAARLKSSALGALSRLFTRNSPLSG